MRTAIYGAGSLGTIMGAYLTKAGVPVELINRNKKHVEALQKKWRHYHWNRMYECSGEGIYAGRNERHL